MDIVSRLKQYLDHAQISVTQFADSCSIPRPSASQLLNGRNKKVSDEVISKIHTSYPDLSMLWLLFGEGDMMTTKNIETSAPQNHLFSTSAPLQSPDNQQVDREFIFAERIHDSDPKKIDETPGADEPGVMSVHDEPEIPYGFPSSRKKASTPPSPDSFTFNATSGQGKRVMSIVVYYDDNSFESFIPDPSRQNPFVR